MYYKIPQSNTTRTSGSTNILIPCLIVAVIFVLQTIYSFEYFHGSSTLRNGLLIPIALRLIIWTLPIIILLAFEKVNPLTYLKLNSNLLKGVLWGFIIGVLIPLLKILANYIYYGKVHINFSFGINLWIGSVLLVGLSEEVLFRGFILQRVNKYLKFWIANFINALLFTLIHYPGWIMGGSLTTQKIIISSVYVIIFALLQGFILKKTKSLWACMIVHSFNNFTSFAFV